MIQEFCLVPKKIVDDFKINRKDKHEDKVHIINKKTSYQPYVTANEYTTDLKDQLKSVLKTKFDKGYSLYIWLKENEKDLEYLKNGEMIRPVSNINLIHFINTAL